MRTTKQKHKARAKTQEKRSAVRKKKRVCSVYGTFCKEHGFVHGAEAEELRAGLEGLMFARGERTREHGYAVNVVDLQELLDGVDARDSLAFREATDTKKGARTE